MNAPTGQELIHAVQLFVAKTWPGLTPRSLTIRFFGNNQQIRLPLFGVPPPPQPDAGQQQARRG